GCAELLEDDIGRIAAEHRTGVVDFLDVALRARRADDIGRIGDPFTEPFEAFAAHVFRQHRTAAKAQDTGNRDAATAVVPGRRPYGAVTGRVEFAAGNPRDEAAI